MNLLQAILMTALTLVAPIATGNILRHHVSISTKALDRVVNWNLYLLVTLLSMLSLWNLHIDMNLVWMPLIACVISVIAGLAGMWRARSLGMSIPEQGSYAVAAMISNRNTAGTIIVFLALGEAGYANARLFVAINWPFLFAAVYPVAAYYQQLDQPEAKPSPKPRKSSLVRLVFHPNQIPVLGIIVGLGLSLAEIPRPPVLGTVVNWLVPVNMWLFLVPFGYELQLKKTVSLRYDVVGLASIKFILTPLAAWVIGRLVGLEGVALYTCVLLGFSPVAIQAVITSRLFKLDQSMAMRAFVHTMVLFLIVVSPVLLFACWWLGILHTTAAGAAGP